MNFKGPLIVILVIIFLCCCGVLVIAGILSGATYWSNKNDQSGQSITETAEFTSSDDLSSQPFGGQPTSGAVDTLATLKDSPVPINDLRDLAMRFEGKTNIPETINEQPRSYQVGDQEKFWVTNTDTNENFQVTAVLQYITDHVYFWVEKDVTVKSRDVKNLVETFEKKTYPKNREFFGSEWTPGIDNDPHLFILYARGGGNVGGYFSSADSVNPLVHEYSNGHESFFISADYVYLGDPEASGTLAHEFQHMIHWYRDRNEESWLNEGFSVLAEFLNGYDPGWVDDEFLAQPDIQLTYWPSGDESYPHYGAGFLFVNYFLDRFGEDATKALVANKDNGMDSVDEVLTEISARDSTHGEPLLADDLFAEWVVTNYINSPDTNGGVYSYHLYQDLPQVTDTKTIDQCPTGWQHGNVNQYGTDYIRIRDCSGNLKLTFTGQAEVGVTPHNAHSGDFFFWSNKGDESDMTLTQTFDFTDHDGPLTLSFWTWYDIEKDYDYLYLTASEDGKRWDIIKTPSCTEEDPSGNSYGCGYNDTVSNWIQEKVDLSKYAGKKVEIRFEYVTDAAVNGDGFLLDDVEIPEMGYKSDFETDSGGWEASGFVRIQNRLPQTFRIGIIQDKNEPVVYLASVNPGETLLYSFGVGNTSDITLAISGTTRFTYQPGDYQFEVQQE